MESPFKYFTWSEFDSPDVENSGEKYMDEAFVHRLDNIRECAGFPFIINSGYRSESHNQKVGGVSNSSHRKGLAVDISAVTDSQKESIARCAIANGVTRIGWGRTFIHLDLDKSKTQKVVWGKHEYGTNPPPYQSLV